MIRIRSALHDVPRAVSRAGAAASLALLVAACTQTLGGSLASGVAGASIGKDLDIVAARAARSAEYRALEYGRTGVPVTWKSGSSHGEVVPGTTYHINDSACRDYVHTLTVGTGQAQSARGTACRQANGTWQPVS
jgi:surface antigen